MTKLITALCQAHRELLRSIEAGGDEKTLSSTARKIESTLLPALKAQNSDVLTGLAGIVMNSGSLKALKLIPTGAAPRHFGYSAHAPDAEFILAQPAGYMREAQKRGFTISPHLRLDLLDQLSEATSNHARMRPEALLLQDPVDEWMMGQIIRKLAKMPAEKAARVAPATTRLLKSGLRKNPEAAQRTIETIFCLHDPAAAHEHLLRTIALYALLGAKAPAKANIEHETMQRLANLIFGRDGRKDLIAQTGGLEAYIASGLTAAEPILKEFENKRRFYSSPGGTRPRWF